TALIGKSHIQHGVSRNVVRPLKAQPTLGDPYPEGWDTLENAERYEAGAVEMPDDFYGFGHVEFALGHGDIVAGHHRRWALDKGGDPAVLPSDWSEANAALARYDGWWQVFQPAMPEELYSTTFVAERTVQWIESAAAGDAPWFVQCSFPDPHHPFTPPGQWWDAYDPDEMEVPESFDDPLTDAPRHLHLIRGLKPSANVVQMFGATREQVRHARAAEYGMIEMIDQGVGRVLDALERSGAADDTIVIFTSDHGDMFGDHGLMLKGTMHYQGVLRVPFVVAQPGQAPTRSRSLASTLDLAQTILDLCGCEPFIGMQGTSLVPVLDDPASEVRDHVFIEDDFPPGEQIGVFPSRIRTLVTDEGRITRYSTGELEVFDLEKDPLELENLAASPAGRDRTAHLSDCLSDAFLQYQPVARGNGKLPPL
ncbi:MAG: sulfatase-like hydrolase/transferase, partial [Deltaproteobacteria bacterium]|nr:sulfatase-like hydrolase/transferase [Deltaproteobacteria bacterium]